MISWSSQSGQPPGALKSTSTGRPPGSRERNTRPMTRSYSGKGSSPNYRPRRSLRVRRWLGSDLSRCGLRLCLASGRGCRGQRALATGHPGGLHPGPLAEHAQLRRVVVDSLEPFLRSANRPVLIDAEAGTVELGVGQAELERLARPEIGLGKRARDRLHAVPAIPARHAVAAGSRGRERAGSGVWDDRGCRGCDPEPGARRSPVSVLFGLVPGEIPWRGTGRVTDTEQPAIIVSAPGSRERNDVSKPCGVSRDGSLGAYL